MKRIITLKEIDRWRFFSRGKEGLMREHFTEQNASEGLRWNAEAIAESVSKEV